MPPQQPQPPSQTPYNGGPAPQYGPNPPGQPMQPGQPQPGAAPYPPQPGQPAPGAYPQQQPIPAPQQPFNPLTGFRLTGHFRGPQPTIPAAPERPTTPYDFFMNNQPKAIKKPGLPFPKPKTAGAQIAWIAGGGLAVVILIGLITLAVPSSDPKIALVTVAQAQTETLRLCTLGQQQATLSSTKGFAVNCALSLTTEQRQLTSYLSKAGVSLKGKVLSGGFNSTADKRLTASKSASDYDDVFKSVMENQLTTQTRSIQQANVSPLTTVTEKQALAKYSDATKLLLQQLKQ